MLKYEIKLTDDSFRQEELVWSEKYLAPDLSFVSGVTSQDYHLEKFKKLPLTNKLIDNTNSIADLETENVTREGYIVIKNKQYKVNSGSVVDYSVDSEGILITYDYIFLNGKYYYADTADTFHIDNWLTEKIEYTDGVINTSVVEDAVDVTKEGEESIVKLDTVVWIEDGTVIIDGERYFFDEEEQISTSSRGGLKYFESGACLDYTAITECDGIEYHPFASTNEYSGVTKFILTKQEEIEESFDRISFCKYFFYVKYKNNYLPIKLEEDTKNFKCDIPKYLLGIENEDPTEEEYYETVPYYVYYHISDTEEEILSGLTFDTLLYFNGDADDAPIFIRIEDKEFGIEHDIMNANDGKEIAIYLNGDTSNMAIGDKIKFINNYSTSHTQYAYSVNEYGFSTDDTDFVLFNGKKYKFEPNICDRVIINGNEYLIDYVNKKEKDKDCLVLIGEEKVPMSISSVDGGEYSAGTLTRYGRIITSASTVASEATYNIIPYDGITVDNKRYILTQDEDDGSYFVQLDRSNEYTFIIEDIKGSSMVVCRPDINKTDFTDEFDNFISEIICKDVVDNQSYITLYVKNNIFGSKEITEDLAFQSYDNPISSDDYYNLFENLVVFSKNGYIHIPLALSNSQGNNILQDDIVEDQFFKRVKEESINPIVDMEKDVYYPKYIMNSDEAIMEFLGSTAITDDEREQYQQAYIGSYTDFHTVREIRVNPHFRTRNLDSWKVNEDYNNVSVENDDNWFILDTHPYRDIITDSTKLINAETLRPYGNTEADIRTVRNILLNTSDLVGLLYFTDNDIYYQKTKVAKSFLRLSYYDAVNPQTQSLLATSTVFMDEHKLFKTFIDNSRKNVSDYGIIVLPTYENHCYNGATEVDCSAQHTRTERVDVSSGSTLRKVSVLSEYLGDRKDNRDTYLRRTNPYVEEFNGTIITDKHRIGSEFIINNKIETDTSSEGYYLYIFREYSENLYPRPIYMKVEFNHAGIGRTIPFIIPMRWEETADEDGNVTPISALTLSDEDLPLLRQGVRLEDVYSQSYIPLYAVYDFKNKEYAYVFDNRYVTIGEDNTVVLNLFELKVQNEEIPATAATIDNIRAIQREITMKQQVTARINVNNEQFPET